MTKYEFYDTTVTDSESIVWGAQWRAQTITIGTTGPNQNFNLENIKLKLFRDGSTTRARVHLVDVDSSGFPDLDKPSLSYGETSVSGITTNTEGEWVTFNMTPVTLKASTQYAIVFEYRQSNATTIGIKRDNDGTYTGGEYYFSINDGISWSASTSTDLLFEVNGTEVPSYPIDNTNLFSQSYNIVESFLKDNISDPRNRSKPNWIHASIPNTNSMSFEGYPFIVLKINLNEDERSFSGKNVKNFRALITIYSNEPTDIETICNEISEKFRDETKMTEFKLKVLESSPISWTLDMKGKKVLFRELTLDLKVRI